MDHTMSFKEQTIAKKNNTECPYFLGMREKQENAKHQKGCDYNYQNQPPNN